ncbi:hypothetical protein CRP_182 [Candidatus Carsonella ruddii PV]|uniref:Uncharacterized protein n=1 Tax=Carsonella ruddii (strain PV) TaxID=387662 RepID=Q05FF8_CARRP|nr:hypothetical protein [Candidatus Carsonella ruddii]BAF35213.1 hypothetical protein CRP_182 [Candidatus Carsonella ruddii PV]
MVNLNNLLFLNKILFLSNSCNKKIYIEIYKKKILFFTKFKNIIYLFNQNFITEINSLFIIDLKKILTFFNFNNFVNYFINKNKLILKNKNQVITFYNNNKYFFLKLNYKNFYFFIKKLILNKLLIYEYNNIKLLELTILIELFFLKNSILLINYNENILVLKSIIINKKTFFFLKLKLTEDFFYIFNFKKFLLFNSVNEEWYFKNKIKTNFNSISSNLIFKFFIVKYFYIVTNFKFNNIKEIKSNKNTILKITLKKNFLNFKFLDELKTFSFNIKILIKNISYFTVFVNLKKFLSIINYYKNEVLIFYTKKEKKIILTDYNTDVIISESILNLYGIV